MIYCMIHNSPPNYDEHPGNIRVNMKKYFPIGQRKHLSYRVNFFSVQDSQDFRPSWAATAAAIWETQLV